MKEQSLNKYMLKIFISRRIRVIKLAYYILIKETYLDIKNYFIKRWLLNIANRMAYKESVKLGKPGAVGETKGWKYYLKISKW